MLNSRGRRLMIWSGAALMLLLGVWGVRAMVVTPDAPAAHAAIDPEVTAQFAGSPNRQATFALYLGEQPDLTAAHAIDDWAARGAYVVQRLQDSAEATQSTLRNLAAAGRLPGHVTEFEPFWITNAVVVTGDAAALAFLAQRPEASRIVSLGKLTMPPQPDPVAASRAAVALGWGVDHIDAEQVWSQYGVTGQGVVVGVVDTGVDWDHPGLINQYRGWSGSSVDHNYNWFNPDPDAYPACPDPAEPCDWNQHGTHVTGITTGGDGASQVGVAPGAEWIHALGCCPGTDGTLAALQWMLAPTDLAGNNPDPSRRPHVINNSWGGFGGNLVYEDALRALRAAGVLPVFAAGNDGPDCATIGSPGDNPSSFVIGAAQSDDAIAWFSSRGPNPFTGVGPDMTAPGVGIPSTCFGDAYCGYSGTSQAAPHVAGAAALLLSAEPDLIGEVDQIEEILRQSAVVQTSLQTCSGVDGAQRPNNTYGYGRLNALAAVELALDGGTVQGVVTETGGGPVAAATVSLTRGGTTLTQQTGDDGSFSFVVAAGAATMSAQALGYEATGPVPVAIVTDQVVTQDLALTSANTAVVSGTVSDASSGRPIPGATVTIEAVTTSETDRQGAFALADVPWGDHDLAVAAPGFKADAIALSVSGRLTQTVALQPTHDYRVARSGDFCGPVYDWIDVSDGDRRVLGDDAHMALLLSEPFTFYGETFSTLYLSSNGFVSFGEGADWPHGIVPFEAAPNNAIYAFATDLNPAGGKQGSIYTKTLDDGRFVVQFTGVPHWPNENPETFQLILDSADNSITMQYQRVRDPADVVVGVENAAGDAGVVLDGAVTDESAVRFTPFVGLPPESSGAGLENPSATVLLPTVVSCR